MLMCVYLPIALYFRDVIFWGSKNAHVEKMVQVHVGDLMQIWTDKICRIYWPIP